MLLPWVLGKEKTAESSTIRNWRAPFDRKLLRRISPQQLAKLSLVLLVWAVAAGGVAAGPGVSKGGRRPTRPIKPEDAENMASQQLEESAALLRQKWAEDSLRQAVSRYEQAARLRILAGQFRAGTVASLHAAETCFLLGDYRAALERYEKVALNAAKLNLKLEEAEALSQSGRLYSLLGDNDAAEARVNQALRLLSLYRDANAPLGKHVHAISLANLGEINYSKGNLVKALDFLQQALTLWREVGDLTGESRTHLFIGYIAGGTGQPDKASDEFSQALALYRATGDRSGEGSALTALGLVHSSRREEEEAIRLHRDAGQIFRTIGDRQNEAITLNALGQVYENLSDFRTALENYQQAFKLFKERGTLDFASVSLFKIAQMYKRAGSEAEALRYYQECLRMSRAAKKARTEASALRDMAAIYAAQGNRVQTLARYTEILKFYARIGDDRGRATTLNNLGDFLLQSGEDNAKALDCYRQALSLSERIGDPGILVATLYGIARVSLKLGALDEALSNVRRSISIIEERRGQIASPDFKTSFFAGVRRNYDLAIEILMQLDRQRPGNRYAEEALLVSEQGRARSLVDTLNQAGPMLSASATPELLRRERELAGLLRAHAQYRLQVSLNHKSQAECDEVEREIDQLETRYKEVESQLRVENPALKNLMSSPRLTLKDIQAQLGNQQTLLLEYALGDERSYLWCVTVDSVQSYELPARKVLEESGRELYQLITARAAINDKATEAYQADVQAADSRYDQQALRLSGMLLGPVADQLGSKRLIIVSEGVLQYIPFDALPSLAGSAGGDSSLGVNQPTLLAAHEVITLPSISTLAAIRQQQHKSAASERVVAVLADPVFSREDNRVTVAPAQSAIAQANPNATAPMLRDFAGTLRDGSVARLAHASDEADAIQAVTPRGTSLIVKGFDANREAAMSSQVSEYRIIHFATHGFLNSEHPELSGIVLSMVAPNGEPTNGLMPLSDIYNLHLSTDLVVLSACETGLGTDVKGEGLVGLTRGFMSAGSKSVVASLWKVDDRATAALMQNFYKFMLQDGMTPSAALRAAKLKVSQEKAWRAPYFWAGFVLQGEYNQQIVVDSKSRLRIALAVFLVLILISVGLIFRQRHRGAQLREASP